MKKNHIIIAFVLVSSFLLSACKLSDADGTPTPTLSAEEVQTLAVETFSAALTQTQAAMPTSTSTPTVTPSPTMTNTPIRTPTSGTPFAPIGVLPTTSSCNSMAFVADVNVSDNTPMTPGQAFTKTWRVKNNGSCVWEAGFKFNFVGGDAMGSSALVLDKPVSPGENVELSVAMVAPSTAGTIRSNWRMSTAAGAFFGDEVYVQIIVGGSSASATPGTPVTSTSTTVAGTATETAVVTATATAISDAESTATSVALTAAATP